MKKNGGFGMNQLSKQPIEQEYIPCEAHGKAGRGQDMIETCESICIGWFLSEAR